MSEIPATPMVLVFCPDCGPLSHAATAESAQRALAWHRIDTHGETLITRLWGF